MLFRSQAGSVKMKDIEAIREALAAGPTPGPWIGAGPSHGKPLPEYLNSVVYDGEDGDESDATSPRAGIQLNV